MDIDGWDKRYRSGEKQAEDLEAPPNPLLVETAQGLAAGKALDLACGTGRNALWLAEQGWRVTAVDGAPAAIEILLGRARERRLEVDARVADLERGEYMIQPGAWDFISICYYLQRDLFQKAKQGVRPGGLLLAIAHVCEAQEVSSYKRLNRGELAGYFDDWEILHRYEGAARDASHLRPVAEIVARRRFIG